MKLTKAGGVVFSLYMTIIFVCNAQVMAGTTYQIGGYGGVSISEHGVTKPTYPAGSIVGLKFNITKPGDYSIVWKQQHADGTYLTIWNAVQAFNNVGEVTFVPMKGPSKPALFLSSGEWSVNILFEGIELIDSTSFTVE